MRCQTEPNIKKLGKTPKFSKFMFFRFFICPISSHIENISKMQDSIEGKMKKVQQLEAKNEQLLKRLEQYNRDMDTKTFAKNAYVQSHHT